MQSLTIHHMYSVQENHNAKVFATYGHWAGWPAGRPVSRPNTAHYIDSRFSFKSQMSVFHCFTIGNLKPHALLSSTVHSHC